MALPLRQFQSTQSVFGAHSTPVQAVVRPAASLRCWSQATEREEREERGGALAYVIRNRIGPLISVVEYFFPTTFSSRCCLLKGNGRGFDPRRGFAALLLHALELYEGGREMGGLASRCGVNDEDTVGLACGWWLCPGWRPDKSAGRFAIVRAVSSRSVVREAFVSTAVRQLRRYSTSRDQTVAETRMGMWVPEGLYLGERGG